MGNGSSSKAGIDGKATRCLSHLSCSSTSLSQHIVTSSALILLVGCVHHGEVISFAWKGRAPVVMPVSLQRLRYALRAHRQQSAHRLLHGMVMLKGTSTELCLRMDASEADHQQTIAVIPVCCVHVLCEDHQPVQLWLGFNLLDSSTRYYISTLPLHSASTATHTHTYSSYSAGMHV